MSAELDVEPGNCRGCAADVLFVRSATSDKRLILDAKPEKRVLVVDGIAETPIPHRALLSTDVGLLVGPRARIVDTYIDHHATCPMVDQFRKTKTPA